MENIKVKEEPLEWIDDLQISTEEVDYADFIKSNVPFPNEMIKMEPTDSKYSNRNKTRTEGSSSDRLAPTFDLKNDTVDSSNILKQLLMRGSAGLTAEEIKQSSFLNDVIKKEPADTDSSQQISLITQKIKTEISNPEKESALGKNKNIKMLIQKEPYLPPKIEKEPSDVEIDIFEPELTVRRTERAKEESQTGIKTYKRHKLCPTQTKQYLCGYCDKPYPNIVSLKEHEEEHNASNMKFKCNLCTFSSVSEKSLKKHSHFHNKGKSLYECAECDYTSTVLRQFKIHKIAHVKKKFKCADCQYTSPFYKNMEKHRLCHLQESFKCEECNFSSRRLYYLKMHMLIHTGTKGNKCNHCDYTGSHPRYLRLHKKVNSHY